MLVEKLSSDDLLHGSEKVTISMCRHTAAVKKGLASLPLREDVDPTQGAPPLDLI